MINPITMLLLLNSIIAASPVFACEDPCPSVQVGHDFEQTALQRWTDSQKAAPQWRGVSSYHVSESEAHYTTFVADSSTVLVGESDCALSHPAWVTLNWEKVGDEEFKTISALEAYYQSLFPILELKKARYGDGLTVYLLETKFNDKIEWIFRLYTSMETGSRSLGGAYAHRIPPTEKK